MAGDFAVPVVRDEVAELFFKWLPEMVPFGGGERAVGEAVIRAGERDNAGTAGVNGGGFQSGFDGFGAGVREDDAGVTAESERDEFASELEF